MSSESALHRSQTELGIHFTVSATKSGIMSKSSRYPSTGIKSGTMSIGDSAYATVSAANSFAYQGVSFFSWQETLPIHLFSFFLIFLSLCRRLFCYHIYYLQACTSPCLFRRGATFLLFNFLERFCHIDFVYLEPYRQG